MTTDYDRGWDNGIGMGLVIGALICVLGAVLIGAFAVVPQTRKDYRPVAVCQYLHGQMHGDVCIVNGKVVPTK
jgi:hypothetical protein